MQAVLNNRLSNHLPLMQVCRLTFNVTISLNTDRQYRVTTLRRKIAVQNRGSYRIEGKQLTASIGSCGNGR